MRSSKVAMLTAVALSVASCGGSSSGSANDAGVVAAGADASSSTGPDSGAPPGADAAHAEPADFTISVAASCPSSPCGGAVLGTWDYASLCIPEAELLDPIKAFCPTATLLSASGTGRGRVTFGALSVVRDIDWSGTGSLNVPEACSLGGCANAQAALRMVPSFATATCTGTADCACTVPLSGSTLGEDAYTQAGSQLKLATGHDYDYCVSGSTLTYKDVTAATSELGVATLIKR